METEAALADRIGRERAQRGWSLAEVAERSGVSRSMLSKIERQEASPTATVLLRIAAAFEVTLAELLTEPAAPSPRLARAADQPGDLDRPRQSLSTAPSLFEPDAATGAGRSQSAGRRVRRRAGLFVRAHPPGALGAGRGRHYRRGRPAHRASIRRSPGIRSSSRRGLSKRD